jgi:hypothetical protein
MPTYRVRIKPGVTHGRQKQYGPGDVLSVSEGELEAFGDKFTLIETLPDGHVEAEGQDEPELYMDEDAVNAQVAAVIARLEERFGSETSDEVEPETVEQLQARMRRGDVPRLEEVVGPSLAQKLDAAGLGDPITVYYAPDGDLRAIKGLGVGTLRKLRNVYGKAGD